MTESLRFDTTPDAFFTTGRTHRVCQDYARVGVSGGGYSYILLSDGCSSTSDTDIGARLLVRAAEFDLKRDTPLDGRVVIARAWAYAAALGLDPACLNATLLAAYFTPTGTCRITLWGDGFLAYHHRDTGKFDFFRVEYPSGYPWYLNYLMDNLWLKEFKEKSSDPAGLVHVEEDKRWKFHRAIIDGEWNCFFTPASLLGFEDIDLVALFTDGAASFQAPDGPHLGYVSIPPELVLAQALDIKGYAGTFVDRRCRAFLDRYCRKELWHHNDDFSMAAIHIKGPQDTGQ